MHLKMKNPLCNCESCGGGMDGDDMARVAFASHTFGVVLEKTAPDRLKGEVQCLWDVAILGSLFARAIAKSVVYSMKQGDEPVHSSLSHVASVLDLITSEIQESVEEVEPGWTFPDLALGVDRDRMAGEEEVSDEVASMISRVIGKVV